MSQPKKFGTFEGVLTPSLLTILGVIMYMRLGWVVGNVGLWGAIAIILIAHVISVTTGLSVSSIATDKDIKAGGIYYILSRSLGLPIGGTLGIALFAGTGLSIALYLVGFSESFNEFMGWPTDKNGLRMTGTGVLILLSILAYISTSIALKTQFLILTAIALSLVSIFAGSWEFAPETFHAFPVGETADPTLVFAIFFPAVTGFTAGVAMSGDLQSPRRNIPRGTLGSISIGLIVYLALAVFLALAVSPEILRQDYNILMKLAWYAPLVLAGIWGATLSSALGGILGAPRIMQALSMDKIAPPVFGKLAGKNQEPRNALLITFALAEVGILLGELNLIARIVTMFYLTAYGFINLAALLESWASSDYRPTFKIPDWVCGLGFVATFAVMFKLDMLAMLGSFLIMGGIFYFLAKKQLSVVSGDVWQSVWSSVVKKGLEQMAGKDLHQRNWRPNILLFTGGDKHRPFLIEFAQWLAGNLGLISKFELIPTSDDHILISKMEQAPREENGNGGMFHRRLECDSVYDGVVDVARVYGFSGVEPNTVIMGWARNSADPAQFAVLTRKLTQLDYNVLYLDYDKRRGWGKKSQIDIWWRGAGNNAYLTLSLVKFILISHDWRNATVRIILVNNKKDSQAETVQKARQTIESFRFKAELKVIDNTEKAQKFYDIMEEVSAEADLIMVGIPEIPEGREPGFVERTNQLVDVLGTTLLVKASSYFEETEIMD